MKERAEVAARGLTLTQSSNVAASEEVAVWSIRVVTAERDVGDPARTMKALEAHLARMQELERLAKVKESRGSAVERDVAAATYRRAEAEVWLEQERARK